VRITEVDFHIRGHCEGFVFGHLQLAFPGQRPPQGCGEPANLPAQCGDDRRRHSDFFDNMSHEWTMKFVEHRVADRRILRLIQKWLKAGISEDGQMVGE
jgi:hypothetical protein